ncbi:amino acid adenylation domain-containing protein [Pseudoalteromonas rhizosphaerae]|uniref:Amino acid adenylation domain-containing protein n=1 Tax=Pseudoalteromonas rhizosphaerae TaxID=2518973 RepID=A0ABW8L2N5_9GAMM
MEKLLKELNEQGIFFFVEENKLKSRAQKGAITPEVARQIRQHRDAIVTYLTENEGSTNKLAKAPGDFYDASFAEQQLWALDQLENNQLSQYHLQTALRLNGELDKPRLKAAITQVVQSHPILRAAYHFNERVVTEVMDCPDVPLAYYEVSSTEQLDELIAQEVAIPFDLSAPPMIRSVLFELDQQTHVLLLVMHHIAVDGKSMVLLTSQIFTYYEQLNTGSIKPVELEYDYRDYTYWQQEYNQTQMSEDAAYWCNYLADTPPCLDLPLTHVRPDVQSFAGDSITRALPEHVTIALKTAQKATAVTQFHLLQSAFAVLLHRLSGESDILVGTPVLNRPLPEFDDIVGFFANTQILRNRFYEHESFIEFAQRQQQEFHAGSRHSGFPFSTLLDELEISRNLSHSPLFQVEFTMQIPQQDTLKLADGMIIERMDLQAQTTKFDLSLNVMQITTGLELYWEFATDLFPASVISAMHERFVVLLEQIVLDPQQKIGELVVTLPHEREQLANLNDTKSDFSTHSTLTELICKQAQRTPDAIAMEDSERQLTYRQLVTQTGQLARAIQVQGIGKSKPVALYFERSIDMLLAIIAVQRAGGAYLPLEPEWPLPRIIDVLFEAQCELVLSGAELALNHPCQVLTMDQLRQMPTDPQDTVIDQAKATDLAYVLFTSGSTGKPKGVMVEHRAVVNRIEWMAEAYSVGSQDVVLQKTPYTFDVSVWEFFLPLISGAKLYIAPAHSHAEPLQLRHILQISGATIAHFVPSMLQLMLNVSGFSQCTQLRHVMCSGEVLSKAHVRAFYQQVAGVELHNLYGPTEAAIDVSFCKTSSQQDVISIGHPIQNIRLHVLDQYHQLLPLGCVGELHIEGVGLARGYINRPELSATQFITLPFNGEQCRLYKTGDLVRWNSRGELEYLGRNDRQVKLNGIRFELAEIENAICQLAGIQQAAVCQISQANNKKLLVCFYIASKEREESLGFQAISERLRGMLPHYAIPNEFVRVDAFPLSANGKLNYKELYSSLPTINSQEKQIAPTSELEKKLAALWMRILTIDNLSVEDNFFQLGGDSILAIRVAAAAAEQGIALGAKSIIAYPTIRALVEHLSVSNDAVSELEQTIASFALLESGQKEELTKLGYLPLLEDAYPMTTLQKGMLFHAQKDQQLGLYHDIIGTRLKVAWNEVLFKQALTEMVTRHEALRTHFYVSAEQELQLVYKTPEINIEIFDLTQLEDNDIEGHIAQWKERETVSEFNPGKSPWKVVIHILSDSEISYYLCVQHALLDGWSVASFDTELFDRYWHSLQQKEYVAGQIPLLNRYYVAEELVAQSSEHSRVYWRDLLKGVQLPWWSAECSAKIERVVVPISPKLSKGIERIAKLLNVQEKSVLLAAHCYLISVLSGRRDTLTGNVCNGRPERHGGVETLGLFLNAQPFRVDLDGKGWEDIIEAVELQSVAGLSHRHYPIAAVHEDTGLDFSASLFNFTRFHVYKQISEKLDVVSFDGQLQTNYKFTSEFSKNLNTDFFELSLFLDSVIFPAQFRARIVRCYIEIFKSMLDDLKSDVDFATLIEHTAMPVADEKTFHNNEQTVLSRFAEVAKAHANKFAVVEGGESLSYAQLDKRSSDLALYLTDCQVVAGDKVGLFMPPGITTIVAILAVLKCGAAYVPIDLDNPQGRTELIVEDAELIAILTTADAAIRCGELPSDNIIVVSASLFEQIASQDLSVKQLPAIVPDQLAYVIYTSGSTGKPKGVLVNHRPLNHLFDSTEASVQFRSDDNWVLFHSYAFDFSVWEIWGALLFGATLHIPDNQTRRSPQEFRDYLLDNRITILNQTPSAFYSLIDEDSLSTDLLPLRLVILSGDKLNLNRVNGWAERYGAACELLNIYGITETTVFVSEYKISQEEASDKQQSIIGKPLPGYEILLVDENMCPALHGVPSEMLVGGGGVTSGYLNRPELTEERFITLPSQPGKCFYRTGDLARYDEQMRLVYLGRKDKQVKIRGYRIELGEIQAAIAELENVKDAAVMCIGEGEAAKKLIAYMSWNNSPVDVTLLREQLKKRLPNYMVPAHFQYIEDIPLNINGKVDEKKLAQLTVSYDRKVAPETPMEAKVAAIWKQVLGHQSICVETDFFTLGGDSLSAIRVVGEIQQQLKKSISIRDLLEYDTVRSLSLFAERDAQEVERKDIITPDFEHRFQPFALTDVQQAYWLGRQGGIELSNVGTHSYTEIPIHSAYVDRIGAVWNELILRHEMLRMVLTEDGLQRILPSVPEYKVIRYELKSQSEAHLQKMRDDMSHNHFSGTQWPLFDLRITELSNGDGLLHFSIDALIVDASSAMILISEFAQLLLERSLAPLTLSFRDYVVALEESQSGQEYQAAQKYWLKRIAEFPKGPALPTQMDPKTINAPRFERSECRLAAQSWEQVKANGANHGLTSTGVVMAVLTDVLHMWSGTDHFALNMTLFNRQPVHSEVNQLVGDFTTLTLLEADNRAGEQHFVTRANRLQSQLWSDLSHRSYSGVAFQRTLTGHRVEEFRYPVVLTSTLGLEQFEGIDELKQVEYDNVYGVTQTSQVWLDCKVYEEQGALVVEWDSVVGLFDGTMLNDMFTAFEGALQSLTHQDSWHENSLIHLPIAQQQLIDAVNDTFVHREFPLLHKGFERSARQFADKIAVVNGEHTFTYQQLDYLSHHFALQLQALNVSVNSLVAVVMEKSWQQVVAVLAILRAGAAYLPIDANLPESRIKQLLEQGGVSVALCNDLAISRVNERLFWLEITELDYYQTLPDLQSTGALESDLAYVIFTSGSTGNPKGVAIEHRGATNTILDINERYQVDSNDVFIGLSNLNFDLSVYDIFGALGLGATLVLPKPEEAREPDAWLRYLNEYRVTVWNSVPALMQMLVDYVEPSYQNLTLRLLMMSGDWIATNLPSKVQERFPICKQHSLGGATEASIWSIAYSIKDTDIHTRSVPYGKALSNQQFFVLDSQLNQVPIWVEGDLYIAGVGLAREYWRDEQKTLDSFITHPISGVRLYRTGDRGRLLDDGNIEFLGRLDQQVKVQGHRIELEEIEHNLLRHSSIDNAVVTAKQNEGRNQLVAYLVPSQIYQQKEIVDNPEPQSATFNVDKLFSLPQSDMQKQISLRELGSSEYVAPVQQRLYDEDVENLLELYQRQQYEESGPAKGLYPSVSALYPVRLYLRIVNGTTEPLSWPSGYYLYEPLSHRLQLVSSLNDETDTQVNIAMVSNQELVETLYQHKSREFCELEVGYMLGLLDCVKGLNLSLSNQHLSSPWHSGADLSSGYHVLYEFTLSKADTSFDQEYQTSAHSHAAKSEMDILLREYHGETSFSFNAMTRKSYRKFKEGSVKAVDIDFLMSVCRRYLHGVDNNTLQLIVRLHEVVEGEQQYARGFYSYCRTSHRLLWLKEQQPVIEELMQGAELKVMQSAIFSLFMVSPESTSGCHVAAGKLSQALQCYLPEMGLGVCPVGMIKNTIFAQVSGIGEQNGLVTHTLIGGYIDHKYEAMSAFSAAPIVPQWYDLEVMLANILPHYMIPKAFVYMDAMPLTANGKVDRISLPDVNLSQFNDSYVAPENDLETRIQSYCQSLLEMDSISVTQNLLNIGADSLMIVRLVNHIRNSEGINISIAEIFSAVNIRSIASKAMAVKKRNEQFQQLSEVTEDSQNMEHLSL